MARFLSICFLNGFLATASSAQVLGENSIVDFRWGNQITESIIDIKEDGSYTTVVGRTGVPHSQTADEGQLSAAQLEDLKSAIDHLDDKVVKIAEPEPSGDGSNFGWVVVRRSDSKILNVQSRAPEWHPKSGGFTSNAFKNFDTNFAARNAIIATINKLLPSDAKKMPVYDSILLNLLQETLLGLNEVAKNVQNQSKLEEIKAIRISIERLVTQENDLLSYASKSKDIFEDVQTLCNKNADMFGDKGLKLGSLASVGLGYLQP
jgi:hypothetical protein